MICQVFCLFFIRTPYQQNTDKKKRETPAEVRLSFVLSPLYRGKNTTNYRLFAMEYLVRGIVYAEFPARVA